MVLPEGAKVFRLSTVHSSLITQYESLVFEVCSMTPYFLSGMTPKSTVL